MTWGATFEPDAILFRELALGLGPQLRPGHGRTDATRVEFELHGRVPTGQQAQLLAEFAALWRARQEPLHASGAQSGLRLAGEVAALHALRGEHPIAELLWSTQQAALSAYQRPLLMGIVNVTPDSFSDGGQHLEPAAAIEHGLALAHEGAQYLDVGGESTRPGSAAVSTDEELARVLPVVAGLSQRLRDDAPRVRISVDTQKAAVAAAALEAGAALVNDVSAGLTDPEMLALVADRGAGYCAMHMPGTPATMQVDPRYDDVVAEVGEFLRERTAACLRAGIELSRIAIDPGIGFGKRLEHNLDLLRRLPQLRSLGLPILMGVSRKSFIADIDRELCESDASSRASARLGGTAAALAACVHGGAAILRVHDVALCAQAARVASALAVPSTLGGHS